VLPVSGDGELLGDNVELDVHDLGSLVAALQKIAEVPALVSELRVGSYAVSLRRHDDQRDGTWYVVTGIKRWKP
jgi:hypothetical protein